MIIIKYAYKIKYYKIIGLVKQVSKKLYKIKNLGSKNNNNKSKNTLIDRQEITNQVSEFRIQQTMINNDDIYKNLQNLDVQKFNNNVIRNKVLKSEEEYYKSINNNVNQNIDNSKYNIEDIDTPTLNRVHKISKENKSIKNEIHEEEDELPDLDPHNIFNRKK